MRFLILALILLLLNFLDLLTTYQIVCLNKGIELNKFFIYLVYKLGFIPAGVIKTLISIFILSIFYFIYKRTKFDIVKISCIIGILIYILPLFLVVIFNLSSILGIGLISYESVENIAKEVVNPDIKFDYYNFCKLIKFK
jgi:hypothetical protein